MGSSSILWTEALLSVSRGTSCAHISGRLPCSPPPTLQHLIPRSPWRWRFILPGTSFPGRVEASEWPARDSCRTGAPQGWASQQGWAWAGELGSPPAAARPGPQPGTASGYSGGTRLSDLFSAGITVSFLFGSGGADSFSESLPSLPSVGRSVK